MLVEHHPAGYRLAVDPSAVDAHRCVELLESGRGADALRLWRGTALADVDAPFARQARQRLTDVLLRCTVSAGSEDDLRRVLSEHPLREDVRAALMRVLAQRPHAGGPAGVRAGPGVAGRGAGRRSLPRAGRRPPGGPAGGRRTGVCPRS